jgi:hypothetical protein
MITRGLFVFTLLRASGHHDASSKSSTEPTTSEQLNVLPLTKTLGHKRRQLNLEADLGRRACFHVEAMCWSS